MRYFPSLTLSIVLVALTAGCSTFEKRSVERSNAFAQLDESTRDRLKSETINVGDTPDMVYIALGEPNEKRERVTKEGKELAWVYQSYYREYQGQALVGYSRHVSYNPKTKTYSVYYVPEHTSVYTPKVEDRFRVFFRNGKVTAIETAKTR